MRSPSRARALVLLAIVLDLPVLARLARALTRAPSSAQIDVNGTAVEVVRPGGEGPWPAWLFVNGAHPLRRKEPVVARLSEALARAGYVVFVPDVPGLGEGTITARTYEATLEVVEAACASPDARAGRVALIGASTGAGLALLAAADERVASHVSVVAAVAPFADLRRMICLATTGAYLEGGEFVHYEVTALHRQVVARSLVATIPDGRERVRLVAELDRADREERDPIDVLPHDLETAEAQTVVRLLVNRDPERFAELFGALPMPARDLLARMSPVGSGADVQAPVEIVVPPSDIYFPRGERDALAGALPNVRLTVTATLDHTRPRITLSHLRSAIRFDRFVRRGLAAAAAPG